MDTLEIIIIASVILFFLFLIGNYIYKKIHHLPTGECACCSHYKKGNKLIKDYHKKYKTLK